LGRPRVSVIIPVLDAGAYLAEAIESVLGQSEGALELIVVDDGSCDDSLEIAARYTGLDGRVRSVSLPRDPATRSGARASNVGLDLARGDYIARMDADDIATPDRLELQLKALAERDLDVCGGQTLRFGDREGPIWYPYDPPAMACELVFRSGMANATMLARAEVLKAARFSETEAYEEYELQTRLIGRVRLGNCPETLLRLRVHRGQATAVLAADKSASRWRLRFGHFFRLFPQATLADFSCVNALARGGSIAAPGDLRLAGEWLVRLSRPPDDQLRRRMARRWAVACERYAGPTAEVEQVRADYAARILTTA
jgi:glycosyltransferase involved in cell wall biosynthesis